ncbi:MAG: PEP-CTERM sorting domain-containing protein [Lyngbya sp.]|nr:PEP-CTERM sorting domain-containing protein [Lyngbya sp.]
MTTVNFLKKALMAATGATVVSFVGGQAAEAVTFNFAGSNLTAPSISDTVGGISYTATGFSTNGNDRNVVRRSDGLGVQFSGFLGSLEDPQIDGLGADETLQLAFNKQIRLISATFSRVGFNDDFRLLVDGDELVSADIPGGNFLDFGTGTFDFTSFALPDRTGSVLGFTVADNNDDYFLRSIEVEPVPEPLTILGSLSALGMGAALKKKQQKKG